MDLEPGVRAARRISVIGAPGTGKTTFASRLAAIIGARHIELDALWWAPRWTPVELPIFQDGVRDAVAGDAWVVEGYYLDEAARSVVWPKAEVIVWLDLPHRASVVRALRRAVIRVLRRTELWGTNIQRTSSLSPFSIARFIRRWPTYPATIGAALDSEPLDGKTIVRLRDDRGKDAWLSHLAAERSAG